MLPAAQPSTSICNTWQPLEVLRCGALQTRNASRQMTGCPRTVRTQDHQALNSATMHARTCKAGPLYRIVAEAGDCVSRELLLGQKLLGSAALVASEERSTQSIPSVENPKLVEQACDCSGVPTHSNPCPEQVLV